MIGTGVLNCEIECSNFCYVSCIWQRRLEIGDVAES